jgi:hypothetical protein
MSNDDDGVYQSSANHDHSRKRRLAVAGVVVLAALLGGGAYLITAKVTGGQHTDAGDTGALVPMVTTPAVGDTAGSGEPTPATATATPKPTISTKQAVKQSLSPSPIPTESMSVEDQIKAARELAAREGHPLQRALTTAPGVAAAEAVQERNEARPNGSLRIVTARSDLTGQRELLWAADGGTRYGDVTCTQNFRFSNNSKPTIRPTLLLCWRTSARKSVATVLVDREGKPSTTECARIIDEEWAKLG